MSESAAESISESVTRDLADRIARLEQRDQQLSQAIERLEQREVAPAAKPHGAREIYAALVATLVGALALAISAYTAYVQRAQLRAQVWPRVQLWSSTVNPRYFVTNDGTGPARITAVRVMVNGKLTTTRQAVMEAADFKESGGLTWSSLGKAVLPAGKEFVFMQPSDETSLAKFAELQPGQSHALSISICYCSVLDDCWVIHSGGAADSDEAGPRDACPIMEAERFRQ